MSVYSFPFYRKSSHVKQDPQVRWLLSDRDYIFYRKPYESFAFALCGARHKDFSKYASLGCDNRVVYGLLYGYSKAHIRRFLTNEFLNAEKDEIVERLVDDGEVCCENCVTNEMVNEFIQDSMNPRYVERRIEDSLQFTYERTEHYQKQKRKLRSYNPEEELAIDWLDPNGLHSQYPVRKKARFC